MTTTTEVETLAYLKVSDASEIVTISRDLMRDDNGIDCAEAWDPMLTVLLYPIASQLHPDDPKPGFGEIENIRADELRKLVRYLQSALDTAERLGIIPPELTEAEYASRLSEAKAR